MQYIDTHTHIDGEEFREDLDDVIQRAKDAGALKLLVPGIDLNSIATVKDVCQKYPDFCCAMIGLHPEEVKGDWQEVLSKMKQELEQNLDFYIAIGEVGIDLYWSREFEAEQLLAFEEQVKWAIEYKLPLIIHCRKAQNELVRILRKYESQLHGGIFHCFTGNEFEAKELLAFDGFCLGIGGVLTFKKSNLPTTLPASVPLDRIVVETDAPYMAPTPHRGKRNESAFIPYIIDKLAESYGTTSEEVAAITTNNAKRLFSNMN